MSNAYQQLSEHMTKIAHLNHLEAMAHWDEAVMMPEGGGDARAKALGTLASITHELESSAELAELIELTKASPLSNQWQRTNLALIEKNYRRATCVPSTLIAECTRAKMASEQAWRKMRPLNNWQDFKPLFTKTFSLVKEIAQLKAEALQCNPYDALIDEHSPGFNQTIINPIFTELKNTLPSQIKRIIADQQHDTVLTPKGPFDINNQRQLGLELMQSLGFDFEHGRLDVSHHPFCGGVPEDVRITTRYNEQEFITAAMGICHETGHARYEQNLPTAWRDQPVGKALGMAVHESQSLLIEMYACRCPEFMHFLAPQLKNHFGDDPSFNPDNLYKLYSRVKPGFIRVDADEVTYPLHVILRYELEQQLFNGQLTIDDLPDAWDQKMRDYFDLSTKGDYSNGVMQDVHWPAGIFGYFPAYTLGNLIAAQLFSTANENHPDLPDRIKQGDFSALFAWLNQHIHQRGSSVDVTTLLTEATGSALDPKFYLRHIAHRYQTEENRSKVTS